MSSGQHSSELKDMLTKSNSADEPQGCSSKNEMNHHHHHQQQEALASLFRSLSNLAHDCAQMPSNQLLNIDNCQPTSLLNLTTRNPQTYDTASSSSSIHPSLHGVVAAAAIMQQQLVTAAISQEQSMPAPQTLTTSTSTNIYSQSSQLQTNNQVPFSSDHMSASYPLVGDTATTPVSLEHEVQYSFGDHSGQSQQHHQRQQQPQRINYCTICNKELCNKYFMKTHMLKMHGINLEVDQSGSEEEGVGKSHLPGNNNQDSDEHNLSAVESNESTPRQSRQAANSNQPSDGHQPNKPKSSATTALSGSAKSTTSVMNGFAGNSMGGVVCDICNKELCSKYFLKVHKQNTHGIMTDYQDANQFVYPFSNTLQNPFMPPQIPNSMPTNNMLSFTSNTCFNQTTGLAIDLNSQSKFRSKPSSAKRARMTASNRQSRIQPGVDQHIDCIYRLMMNHPQQLGASSGQLPFGAPLFDPVSANPINTLMCFGAMNPFGPTSISPTMVVDMILRNQHLINRNNPINQQAVTPSQCPAGKSSKDRNNNDSKHAKSNSGKGTKESTANNSRYFTHYTEACPMCDRRFKSIKWLKTHMMNDHKHEIGTYMQMIMQNMYANKSQPPAQLAAQPYDQASSYSSINLGPRNVSAPQTQHQQNSISYNAYQSQANGILQTEQYNIVQNYLNQQRQMLQQQHQLQTQDMIDIKSEPVCNDQSTKLLSLAGAHRQSRDTSSSSSAGKTSPQSLMTGLECEDDNQQLDLTVKFSLDTRRDSHKRSLGLNEDDYLNDENSTRSSYNHDEEQQKSTTNAIESNDSSRVQVKTTLDA